MARRRGHIVLGPIAYNLRKLRLSRGLTRARLAALVVFHCGTEGPPIHWSRYIAMIEAKEANLYPFTVAALLRALVRAKALTDYERERWRYMVERKRNDT